MRLSPSHLISLLPLLLPLLTSFTPYSFLLLSLLHPLTSPPWPFRHLPFLLLSSPPSPPTLHLLLFSFDFSTHLVIILRTPLLHPFPLLVCLSLLLILLPIYLLFTYSLLFYILLYLTPPTLLHSLPLINSHPSPNISYFFFSYLFLSLTLHTHLLLFSFPMLLSLFS